MVRGFRCYACHAMRMSVHTLAALFLWPLPRAVFSAAREIERKTFHLCGLLVPLWYQQMTTTLGFSERFCSQVCIAVTAAVWVSEVARLHIPAVQRMFLKSPMGRIMREREKTQMTGTPYFVLGCTLVRPPTLQPDHPIASLPPDPRLSS